MPGPKERCLMGHFSLGGQRVCDGILAMWMTGYRTGLVWVPGDWGLGAGEEYRCIPPENLVSQLLDV